MAKKNDRTEQLSYAPKGLTGIESDADLGFYPNNVKPRSHPDFHGSLPGVVSTQDVEPQLSKPSFYESAEANFKQFNTLARLQIGANRILENKFSPRIGWEEGYDPVAEGMLDDVPEPYWGRVLAQTSREQANLVKGRIAQESKDMAVTARSGWVANLTTTLGASFLDPTVFIPVSQTLKYADFSQGILKNAAMTAKVIAPISGVQNAILIGTKETQSINEWMADTLTETLFAASIGGALGVFASKGLHKEANNAKAFFKASVADVDIKFNLAESGEVTGLKAVAQSGNSVGAMQAQQIQALLDSGDVSFKDSKWLKNGLYKWGAPVIEGLTNRFQVVRDLTDKIAPHNFKTAAGQIENISGLSAVDFQKLWQGNRASAAIYQDAQWLDYIGVKGVGKKLQGAFGEWTGQHMSKKEFGESVTMAMRRDGKGEFAPQVLNAAKRWREEVYDPLWKEVIQRHPALKEQNFTNIVDYMNRVYDKNKIINSPEQFLDEVQGYLTQVNSRQFEERNLRIRAKNDVTRTKKELGRLSEAGVAKRSALIDEEVAGLRATVDDLQAKLKTQTPEDITFSKQQITKLEKKISKLEKEKQARTEELLQPSTQTRVKELEEKLSTFEAELTKLDKDLLDRIQTGHITPDMLEPRFLQKIKKAGSEASIEELGAPKLRKTLTRKQIKEAALSIRDNILQLNEEQLAGSIFEGIKDGGNDILKSRVFLWNDALAEKWLVNDIEVLSGLYVDQLSKRIYLEDVLAKYGDKYAEFDFTKSTEGIGRKLREQRQTYEDELLKLPESAERAKQLQRLDKDTRDAAKFLENMFKVYLGNYVDKSTGVYRTTNAIKQFGAGTLLGNVPILMFSDFFSPMFKFAFSEYIADGIVPTVKRMMSVMNGRAKQLGEAGTGYVRGAFADLNLGNNVANGSRMQAMFGYGAQYQPKTLIERYVSNLATLSQNVSLTNSISDFQETTVAFASQSKTIRSLKKYLNGETLNKFEIGHLDEIRLNPKRWAQRIVDQFEKHGETIDDAFLGNYHLWDDSAAAMQIKGSIARETRGIIIRPDLLDQPFAFKDPILSLATQFTSWIFSATLKYTIPTLTDFEGQKMVGILLMMGSAALIDPLRQLSKGEEVDTSFEALLTSSLNNSGPLGWQFDALMRANARIDAPALRGMQPDRFKRKASGALDLGPASGIADMANSLISSVVNGEMNQKDASNAMKLFIPFSNTLLLRKPFGYMLESFNLPKTREKARKRKE